MAYLQIGHASCHVPKPCHPERIRQGPLFGLRWCLPEMREGPQRMHVAPTFGCNAQTKTSGALTTRAGGSCFALNSSVCPFPFICPANTDSPASTAPGPTGATTREKNTAATKSAMKSFIPTGSRPDRTNLPRLVLTLHMPQARAESPFELAISLQKKRKRSRKGSAAALPSSRASFVLSESQSRVIAAARRNLIRRCAGACV